MIYLVNLYNSAVYNNSSGEKSAEEWCSITSIIAAPLEHVRDIWKMEHKLGQLSTPQMAYRRYRRYRRYSRRYRRYWKPYNSFNRNYIA